MKKYTQEQIEEVKRNFQKFIDKYDVPEGKVVFADCGTAFHMEMINYMIKVEEYKKKQKEL